MRFNRTYLIGLFGGLKKIVLLTVLSQQMLVIIILHIYMFYVIISVTLWDKYYNLHFIEEKT